MKVLTSIEVLSLLLRCTNQVVDIHVCTLLQGCAIVALTSFTHILTKICLLNYVDCTLCFAER
jgi:hypothetical protein